MSKIENERNPHGICTFVYMQSELFLRNKGSVRFLHSFRTQTRHTRTQSRAKVENT